MHQGEICIPGKSQRTIHVGMLTSSYLFIVCMNLARLFIFCLDFLRTHKTGKELSGTGERMLTHDKHILFWSIETSMSGSNVTEVKWISQSELWLS